MYVTVPTTTRSKRSSLSIDDSRARLRRRRDDDGVPAAEAMDRSLPRPTTGLGAPSDADGRLVAPQNDAPSPRLDDRPPGLLVTQDSSGNLNWQAGMALPAAPRNMLYPQPGGAGNSVAHGPLVFKNPGDGADSIGVVSERRPPPV